MRSLREGVITRLGLAKPHQDTRDPLTDKQREFAKTARWSRAGDRFGNADQIKAQVWQEAAFLRSRFGKAPALKVLFWQT